MWLLAVGSWEQIDRVSKRSVVAKKVTYILRGSSLSYCRIDLYSSSFSRTTEQNMIICKYVIYYYFIKIDSIRGFYDAPVV